ncbi:hypothetical protein BO94DRAFT_43720 [Aspergillus sclerotioniger CBS 115572]|uniref:Zn(2)-C6 fungal-type domain-containing protein n=1 Tax=Aspergillus sclerotioniger CBS 115572 TaxID=1450535 RepID=A0A317WV54_9EURO|nr:hypothetical protein BO94DRAFT_43720 [Aspergillus sclerotioniger CBS 115572]PWY89691.1 hypothetical protein BO94DRAFT_43720 [Aspergillus sclerotioniger CBS 115572]
MGYKHHSQASFGITKVPSACQRCRRQNLKRPCTLCVRAGARCLPGSTRWRPYQPPPVEPSSEGVPIADSLRSTPIRQSSPPSARDRDGLASAPCIPSHQSRHNRTSSSTISLLGGAFELHNAATPGHPALTAIPGAHLREVHSISPSVEDDTLSIQVDNTPEHLPPAVPPCEPSSVVNDLVSLFPSFEAASLLVDTYFDRVHWFVLIFYQDEFRQRWPKLYQPTRRPAVHHGVGFVSAFLLVIAIGLQYAGPYRRELLSKHGVDLSLRDRILSTVRSYLLDIMSLGSLEAVQTCILLGTYYLYHGAPRLAWPVCGCGLRIAQDVRNTV